MLKSAILILVLSFTLIKLYSRYITISIEYPDEEYDFIIVGGGTTGNVIANRLTENTTFKVLVIEAGREDGFDPLIHVPLPVPLNRKLWNDWDFMSESQNKCCGLNNNNSEDLMRGKILGGTSSINFQYYMRGSPGDYDSWAGQGADGWNYRRLLPYFMKSESSKHFYATNREFHGMNGPLQVTNQEMIGLTHTFLDAVKEMGLKYLYDHNTDDVMGVSTIQTSAKKGIRQSSSSAFLHPVAHERRDRLHIVTNAHVTKVIIQERDDGIKCAVGVEYEKYGKLSTVNAKREVILSGGVFGTPQILMLSGIGPKEHLKKHGIKVVSDLPGVGSNYQDHIFLPLFFYARNLSYGDVVGTKEILYSLPGWLFHGTGPLGTNGGAFANVNFINKNNEMPEFQSILLPIQMDPLMYSNIMRNWNYKDDIFEHEFEKAYRERDGILASFAVSNVLLHPKSKGTVRLRSNDPFAKPMIDPKIYSHSDDIEIMAEGLKWILNVTNTKPFQEIGTEFVPMHTLCDKEKPKSDSYYKCMATSEAKLYHGCCTAKIGKLGDKNAVVDPQLRVYGVERLRVADASVMPHHVSASPQATCYMIGEKAAAMIKESNPE